MAKKKKKKKKAKKVEFDTSGFLILTAEGHKKFKDLVDEATREIHSSLLEGGGERMRTTIYTYMAHAIRWSRE